MCSQAEAEVRKVKVGTMKRNSLSLMTCVFLALVAAAYGQPVLDGYLDPEYFSHGSTLDYQAFIPQGTAKLYLIDDAAVDSNYVWIAWSVGKTYNDLSYGDNKHPTWPGGHTFGDLLESDCQRIWIFNKCGEVVVDATMDLIDGPGYPTESGYDVSMDSAESVKNSINGGDWSKYQFDISFARNLNDFGYWTNATVDISQDSPPYSDVTNYVPTAEFSNWQYEVIWEVRIERSVLSTTNCPDGGVEPALILEPIELHASPNKPKLVGKQSKPPVGYVPAAIGDYVWMDVDRDGVQDVGEPGLGGVTLDLYSDPNGDGDPSDGTVIGTAVTDGSGYYLFDALGEAGYVVSVTDSNGVLTDMSLTTGSTNPHTRVLEVGERYLDADFGYAFTDTTKAAIGDFVWSDADNDGVQDPGEAGIGGVSLNLLDVNSNIVAVTTTALDGAYMFVGLTAGTYRVDVTDTSGVLTGYSLTSGPQSCSDPTADITVDEGEVYVMADFGYFKSGLGTIGNLVWLDENLDGTNDVANENGILGVTVDLVVDSNSNGVWDTGESAIARSTTGSDGTYSFTGLPVDDGDGDANYLVHVSDVHYVLALLYYRSYGSAGLDNNGQVDPYSVTLSSTSRTNLTADFGFGRGPAGENTGVVGDRVWYDLDGDGVQDPEEPGVPGVEMEIWQLKGNGSRDFLLGTGGTDANGIYLFSSVGTGVGYDVVVSSSNFSPGAILEGYSGTSQPDNEDTTDPSWGPAPNNMDLTLDFGYWKTSAVAYSVGDLVWRDDDADGVYEPGNGEEGIDGVTLELRYTNGTVLASGVTDASGNYSFTNLPNGDYVVVITDTSGRLTGMTSTTGGDTHSDAVQDADNLTFDFGYRIGLVPAVLDLGVLKSVDNPLPYEGETIEYEIVLTNNGPDNATGVEVTDMLPAEVSYVSHSNGVYDSGTHLWDVGSLAVGGSTTLWIRVEVSHSAGELEITNTATITAVDQGDTNPTNNTDDAVIEPRQPTLARISAFRALTIDGVITIQWETSVEIGTVGFYLERRDSDGNYHRVNEALVLAALFGGGTGAYEVPDEAAFPGGTFTYRLIEVETTGRQNVFGPYVVSAPNEAETFEEWRAARFSREQLSHLAISAPDADADGDGHTNEDEYLTGTDPLSSESVLRLTRLEYREDGIVLRWTSEAGKTYKIEGSSSPGGNFEAVATDILATPPENQYSPVPGSFSIFRVRLQQ